jgi:hypothetical protein
MFFRATGYSRSELQKAFDDFAEFHGPERALAALEASTGAKSVNEVPEARIVNGLTELICTYSFVGRAAPSKSQAAADSLAKVHSGLAAIREKAFAALSSKAAN